MRVRRSDVIVQDDKQSYAMRSYSFELKVGDAQAAFVCEAKNFASTAEALAAAEKSIAQRPDEQQRKNSTWYARAGLSQWLLAGKTLTWCMQSSAVKGTRETAQAKLRDAFLKKFFEAE